MGYENDALWKGKAFPSLSYAPTGANFNLREYQEDYKAGRLSGVFDQFMSLYPESPDSHSEPDVKRFYISHPILSDPHVPTARQLMML